MTKKQMPLYECKVEMYDSVKCETGLVKFYVINRANPIGEYHLLIDGIDKLAQRENGEEIEKRLMQVIDQDFFTIDEVNELHQYIKLSACWKSQFETVVWSPLIIEQFNPPIIEVDVRNQEVIPMSWRNTTKLMEMYENGYEYFNHIDFMQKDPEFNLSFHLMAEVVLRYAQEYDEGDMSIKAMNDDDLPY
jgi:hypothetical protein